MGAVGDPEALEEGERIRLRTAARCPRDEPRDHRVRERVEHREEMDALEEEADPLVPEHRSFSGRGCVDVDPPHPYDAPRRWL